MVSDEIKQEIKRLFVEEKWTAQRIAGKLDFTASKVRNVIRRIGGAKRYTKDFLKIGEIFASGNLTIVAIGSTKKEQGGSNRQTYDVLCKLCGSITNILRQNLVDPNRKCCSNCMKTGQRSILWKGYKDISLTFFHNIRNGATARDLEFNITIEDLWDLYEKQNHNCALSGVNIHFDVETPDWKGRKPTASLDRIDSSVGYTIDNIQWVHYDVNYMKQDFTQAEFLDWCRLIDLHSRGLGDTFNNDIELKERNHHKNWAGYGNISGYIYGKYRYDAKNRKHPFKVSIEYLWDLFVDQKGLCKLSGLPIKFSEYDNYSDKTASLDRVDSSQGYIKDNLQWIHKDVNFIKHALSQDKLQEWCRLISAYNS